MVEAHELAHILGLPGRKWASPLMLPTRTKHTNEITAEDCVVLRESPFLRGF